MKIPTLINVDHLHIYTKDRNSAQAWYSKFLGFRTVEKYAAWATDSGPLVMMNEEDTIHLVIFEREDFMPSSIIAFGVDGINFIKWKKYLEKQDLLEACKDHEYSWSVYFFDLDGNGLEITTEDYDYVNQTSGI